MATHSELNSLKSIFLDYIMNNELLSSDYNESIIGLIKLKLREDISRSTFHGLSRVFISKNRLLRFKWLVLVLASYSYCTFNISSNIKHYYEYNTITELRETYEDHPPFPEVAIVAAYALNISCEFNREKCENLNQINSETFEFNTGYKSDGTPTKIVRVKEAGEYSGLKLKITPMDSTSESYLKKKDIQIYINNQSVEHSNLYKSVSPGMRNNLVFKRVFEEYLAEPFSNCRTYANLRNQDKATERKIEYRQEECFIFCRYEKYMQNCDMSTIFNKYSDHFYTNSTMFYEFFLTQYETCQNLEKQDLIAEIDKKFDKSGENTICGKECPTACNVVKYSITPYYSRLSNEDYTNGYTEVNVYQESFYYSSIVQKPEVSAYQAICNIGGMFGKRKHS